MGASYRQSGIDEPSERLDRESQRHRVERRALGRTACGRGSLWTFPAPARGVGQRVFNVFG
jgi:hypothetical protein